MKHFFFLVLILFAIGGTTQTPYQNVKIDGPDGFGYPPCEPSIAIDLNDPSVVIGGAILDKVYLSRDSGRTWQVDRLTSEMGVFGDPCLLASPKGWFYYFHLSDPSGKGWSDPSLLDRIVCQTSKDAGRTWSSGAGIGLNPPKDQDKEWACTDETGDHVYVTWTEFDKYASKEEKDSTYILFSCAGPKGKKWSEPVRLNEHAGNCLDGDATVEGAVPCAGRGEDVFVAWALNDTIWFDRSTDGGKTWLEEDLVANEIAGGWDHHIPGISRTNGMPVTALDRSGGEHDGRIYINWADQRNGEEDTDIFICYSDDNGDTWSKAIRVNDDAPGKQQFFPWLALDQSTGYLYTVFYDRRNHDGNATDVYMAYSEDGGASWTNERISESSFTPSASAFFGDYNNIAAVNGVVRPIWTRAEGMKLSVHTALINR